MKILYYSLHDGSFMTEWQRVQIFEELEHAGICVEVFNPASFHSLEQCNEELIKRLENDKTINIFMSCMPDEYFCQGAINLISRISIPKILIQFDNLHAPYNNRNTAKFFDVVWLTSWETEPLFKKWGCKTIFLPYAANPYLYKDLYSSSINKVCFVGTPYGSRTQFINELVNEGDVGVDCFFNKDKKSEGQTNSMLYEVQKKSLFKDLYYNLTLPVGRSLLAGKLITMFRRGTNLDDNNSNLSLNSSLSFEDMNKAYSNYSLSLNVLALRNTYSLRHPVYKLHLRTFEIPMCAGLELVSYNEELSEYFSEDEMVFFKDKDEMLDKARFYTQEKQQSLCRAMKLKARKKAECEHTWTHRFRALLREVGYTL